MADNSNQTPEDSKNKPKPPVITTEQVMEGGPRRDISTPGEGVLTSKKTDRDASTD